MAATGSLLVAATTRTSTVISVLPPRRRKAPSSRTRRSLAWVPGCISAISSRSRVPPWASSKQPSRRSRAPVKAPRSWPKSSLSSRVSGIAAQLTATKGPPERAEQLVEGARHQLLAGAGLAVDQDRRGSGRGLLDEPVDLLHGRAAADEPAQAPHVLDPPPQDRDLVEGPAALERLLDEQPQAVEVHRLGEVVVGALAHRAHRGVHGGPAGQDDDGKPGHLLLQRGQQAQPVHVRHHEVGDDERRAQGRRFLQRLPSLGGDVGGIPPRAQDRLERDPRILLVVDDQDVRFAGHCI